MVLNTSMNLSLTLIEENSDNLKSNDINDIEDFDNVC